MPAKKPVNEIEYEDSKQKEEFHALIGSWYSAMNEAAAVIEREAKLRKEVYDFIYKMDDPRRSVAATEHWALPGNWVLKVETRINAKIDKAALDVVKKLVAELKPDPETGEVPSLDSVVRYEPKLSDAGYRDAHPKIRELLAENHAVEFNPGMPGIKLELPKSAQPKATAKDGE